MSGPAVVAEVVRSGFVEGRHYGSVVALEEDGSVAWSVGDVRSTMLPRSCNKPLQVVAMLRAGLELDDELLALASASHSGEEFHLDGVRRILAGAGLTEDALATPPDWPLDDQAREAAIRAGGSPSRLAMNCSGKHAAMLAACVRRGWDTAGYLAADHPLQVHIREVYAELTGEPIDVVAVDGCGAPLLSTTLTGLARAFRGLAVSQDGPERRVADAMRAFPEWVSGTRRDEARLHRAVPGAVAKAGAEACYVVGLPDGRAVALKVTDGAARARPVLMTAALVALGVAQQPGVDRGVLEEIGNADVLGGGRPVGTIRPVLPFDGSR